jgi:predicted transcriptional regulator
MDSLLTVHRRYGYLEAITSGNRDKSAVAEYLGKSSSTVRKHLGELVDLGVVEETDDGYTLTKYGEVVRANLKDAELAYEAEEIIEALDAPAEVLSQGRYVPSRKHVPNSTIGEIGEHVKNADTVRGLVPVLFPPYLGTYHGQVLDGLDAEFVMEREVLEHIRDEHGDMMDEASQNGTRFFVTDSKLSHGLALLDEHRVGVLVYDDDGHVLGRASFASRSAREHFEAMYEGCKENAERFEP